MKLTFKNYRRPILDGPNTWSASDRSQLDAIADECDYGEYMTDYLALDPIPTTVEAFEDAEMEEWELIVDELVDVVDDAGQALYQIHFFDFGTAYMYKTGTADEVGGGSQHSFELDAPDADLLAALGVAYAAADPKIQQMMKFD